MIFAPHRYPGFGPMNQKYFFPLTYGFEEL